MGKMDIFMQLHWTKEFCDEELKQLQKDYSKEELCRVLSLAINVELAKFFNEKKITGLCEVIPNANGLYINDSPVY
jgi:preprotein translocase subunit Sec63